MPGTVLLDPEADPVAKKRATPKESALARVAFGERLRAARIKAGHKTITDAAEKAGMHRVTLTQLEGGRSAPSVATIDRLVNALNLDPRILFPRESKGKTETESAPVPKNQVSE